MKTDKKKNGHCLQSESLNITLDKMMAAMGLHRVELDPNALTVSEICEATGKNRHCVGELVKEKLKSGEWERVMKHTGVKSVPAYRPKKR